MSDNNGEAAQKQSFCAILCCSTKQSKSSNRNRPPPQGNRNPVNRVQQRPGGRSGRQRDSESPSSIEEEKAPPKKETNLQLVTKFAKADVKCVDEQPDTRMERHHYKYYCPICLRYFTHMLQSECCQNYLCILCAEDLQENEKKNEAYKASCPYNCNSINDGGDIKFKLSDVPLDAQVKRYSDSQCMSFFSNNLVAAQQSLGGNNFQKQGTVSSASKSFASGFRWSTNNKALAAALQPELANYGKENSKRFNHQGSLIGERKLSGLVNINNLINGAHTLSDIGAQEYNGGPQQLRPPKPGGFGMRSVGAGGFPRSRVGTMNDPHQIGVGIGVLSDLDVNSQISAPQKHNVSHQQIASRGYTFPSNFGGGNAGIIDIRSQPEYAGQDLPANGGHYTSSEQELQVRQNLSPEYIKQEEHSENEKGERSPASEILNQMFKSGQQDYVDHQNFGGSFPRTFSPGLSSIGAAGFVVARGSQENLSHMKSPEEEEKQMVNTFGSLAMGGTADANRFNIGNVLPYPGSDSENEQAHQVRLVGVQNYPQNTTIAVGGSTNNTRRALNFNSIESHGALGSFKDGRVPGIEEELIDDTFNVEGNINRIHDNNGNSTNMFASANEQYEERGRTNSVGRPSGQDDHDDARFPPISRQSANFNQEDAMRSLDPLDELAAEISDRNILSSPQVPVESAQEKRRRTDIASVKPNIIPAEDDDDEGSDNLSRAD